MNLTQFRAEEADKRAFAIRPALLSAGVALVPDVFDRALVAGVGAALDRARRDEEERFGHDMLNAIGQLGYVSDVMAVGSDLLELLERDELHELLDEVFGEPPRLFAAQGIILGPGEGRGVWPRRWHADMFGPAHALEDPAFLFAVNFLVLIDDLTSENGATLALPGSQRLKKLMLTEESLLSGRAVEATGGSGSVFLIEGGTWHAAGVNRTAEPRRVLKLMFTRRWIRPQIDYLATASPEVLRGLSPRLRRLLDVGA